MVFSNSTSTKTKDAAKTPAVELKRQVTSITTSSNNNKSIEDELKYLRSQNKVLKAALSAVKDTATEKLSKSYELVWYARNRTRYPSHQASKWLDESQEHSQDIGKLHSQDADFYHGFNSGILAASRMFKDEASVVHPDSDSDSVASAHEVAEKVEKVKKQFPDLSVDSFPAIH